MTIVYVCTYGRTKAFGEWKSCCYLAYYKGQFATGQSHFEAIKSLIELL